MEEKRMDVGGAGVSVTRVHSLVIGSGAAGLNAALRLRAEGVDDVLILTEGIEMGTSINTGSDKQTYYKLSLCGEDADAPRAMAETYFAGGGMHGDLALVEAGLSARAFANLVNLGVPFPCDAYGQFVGYKTDHDPRQRATSIGPYTSREMCRALHREITFRGIEMREGRNVVKLLTVPGEGGRRASGTVALNADGEPEAYVAENVVLAVGGPGGLYRTSVYPAVHTGAIGLALLEGAMAQNLPESQYGLASIGFRWNVSGTYMQVIPAFVSTDADGKSNPREFLGDFFGAAGEMNSRVFLKGYQWPFDCRKAQGGSSLIDILVYVENVLNGRRIFLDFRRNPEGFAFDELEPEARAYLERSGAGQDSPIARLQTMNPAAIGLYLDHGIDIRKEPLEIAVCAQHNNGGLAANHWWESVNLPHLFPVGEVNGSHGVTRPGGSALNSGQVAGFRAAEFIAKRYASWSLDEKAGVAAARDALGLLLADLARPGGDSRPWPEERAEFQDRMTRAGAHIRSAGMLDEERRAAWEQYARLAAAGCGFGTPSDAVETLRNRQLCFAHCLYLEAVLFAVRSGVGSRGSAMVLDPGGEPVDDRLGAQWRMVPENDAFRAQVLETQAQPGGSVASRWVPRRPIPESDLWFETAWARFREGEIYQ